VRKSKEKNRQNNKEELIKLLSKNLHSLNYFHKIEDISHQSRTSSFYAPFPYNGSNASYKKFGEHITVYIPVKNKIKVFSYKINENI